MMVSVVLSMILASWPLSFEDINITEDFALAHVLSILLPQHQDDICMFQNLNFQIQELIRQKSISSR